MKAARLTAILALFFLAVSSCVGGIPLIKDPSGGILKMPLSTLDHSPFRSFLIPGLILFLCNGILSLVILVAVTRRTSNAGLWVAFQGCVLFAWITIEVIMIRGVVWPHYLYWGVAVVLIACGWAMQRQGKASSSIRLVSSHR